MHMSPRACLRSPTMTPGLSRRLLTVSAGCRRIAALSTLLLGVACQESQRPQATPPVNGRYVLGTVDGRSLPLLIGSTVASDLLLVADTVTVTFERAVYGVTTTHSVAKPGGAVSGSRAVRNDTWYRISDTILMPRSSAPTETLFLSWSGYRLRTSAFAACTGNRCNLEYRRLP